MVTYISSANADKYNILFDKASKMLIANPPADRADNFSEDFAITTLNEYFAYLEDLVKVSDQEDISRFFVRLPLDEDFFEIDANSRTIKVPSSSFGRYGVGVQGDELAEVVYFTIDRFFDSTDLASNDINIIIQWEARNENRELIAGISQHFGKDIETIPGKIIFGWPISHELTAAAGTIKFAVRFYQTGESSDEDIRQLVYSFSTLPAEVTINASLNYDVINMSKVDHGSIITGRIKNNGIYDAGAPIPSEPIITIPLYVMSPEGNELVKIVDLPVGENSVVKLAVSARNADIGAISYDWKKFAYDSATGNYEKDPTGDSLPAQIEYVEATADEELSENQEYYTIQFDAEDRVVSASLVSQDRINNIERGSKTITIENEDEETETMSVPIFLENGAEIHLYKKLSVASVDSVGEYAVDVRARTSVNSVTRYMHADERIRIPGPLKPTISLPEETDNVSITEEDSQVHAITDNGSIVLTVPAVPGEENPDLSAAEVGEHPQVTLSYNWKQVIDGVASDVIAVTPIMPVVALPASQLPDDPDWQENASEDGALGAKGIFNQENVDIIQNGTVVNIYPRAELKSFLSTSPSQQDAEHQWLALDVDTELGSIVGATWDDGVHEVYTFEAADENDLGVADGHVLFWIKVDEALQAPVIRKINDTSLTFRAYAQAPSNATYSIDNDTMTIVGLPEEGLDNTYFCEVTAMRNKKTTTETSGNYRVTNSPKAPVLSYNGPIEDRFYNITKRLYTGEYKKLTFDIETPDLSDGIIYLWMHATINDPADMGTVEIKRQIDLDGALSSILGNTEFPGDPDTICDPDVAHYEDGKIVFGDSAGQKEYQLTAESEGIYYCIVINELNNNKAASVGPFFFVS